MYSPPRSGLDVLPPAKPLMEVVVVEPWDASDRGGTSGGGSDSLSLSSHSCLRLLLLLLLAMLLVPMMLLLI